MQINNNQSFRESAKIVWNPQQLILTIQNAERNNSYIILTNLLCREFVPYCSIFQKSHTGPSLIHIQYKIFIDQEDKKDDKFRSEIQSLKYCVLAYDKQMISYLGLIGQNGLLNYHPKIILTENLAVSSEHNIQQQFFNRDITQHQVEPIPSDKNSNKDSNQDTDQLEKSLVLPYHSQIVEVQQYILYVTKMQKEVENLFRNYMFYEMVWKEMETEVIMKRISLNFGDYVSVVQKRRYMQFKFRKDKSDLFFKSKYDSINKDLFIPNYNKKKLQNKIINYYIISKEPFLPIQREICKLFVLPNYSQIIDFLEEDPWIIIAANKYVIFLHNYHPMDYFKHQENICPSKVAKHPERNNIIVIVDKRGCLFYYSLQQTSVTLNAIYYVPFLSPYSFLHMKDSIVIGGIDYEERKGVVNRNKIQNIRFLYVINPQIKREPKSKNTSLAYQRKLQIVIVRPEQNKIPLVNLQMTTQKQVLACTWNNKFYLVSMRGFKLIQVQLKTNITKVMQIPFLFNRLNFMLLISNGQIIRVGVQSYGQCLGAQLTKLNHDQVKDFSFYYSQKSRFQLLICENNKIVKASYLNEQKSVVLAQNSGKIVKVVCNKTGISYLLDLQHSVEVKYLQI